MRNTIVSGNAVGVWAESGAVVRGRYNAVAGNGEDRRGGAVVAGEGDVEGWVEFANPEAGDFRETAKSVTVDAGDPGDVYEMEPEPNGGRVNMGAFGNTVYAVARGESGSGGCEMVGTGSGSSGMLTVLLALGGLFAARRQRV